MLNMVHIIIRIFGLYATYSSSKLYLLKDLKLISVLNVKYVHCCNNLL